MTFKGTFDRATLQHVVRIAADEVLRRAPRMMRVADRVDFVQVLVQVVAHAGARIC
jgi:hypothetical protein